MARSLRRFFKPAGAGFARRQTWFGLHFVSTSSQLEEAIWIKIPILLAPS